MEKLCSDRASGEPMVITGDIVLKHN